VADNEEQANLVVSAVNEATETLREVQKGLEDFEGSAQSLGVTSVALGGILKDVLLKAFQQLKDVVRLGVNEAIDAEQQQVKLANAFKAEGAAAQSSVASINNMADELGALVGVDNDVIVATATTLRQLGGLNAEMINKSMPAIADLAIRTGSLESAAMTVTRAMNGQSRQLKMLGIEFKATGDKGADLEVLLGKINEKFGGDAQALMETAGGKIRNLKVVFTDVAQSIGEGLIQSDAFAGAVELIRKTLQGIKNVLAGISPPEPTYTDDAIGRDKQRIDLMSRQYAEQDKLNALLKEKKDLEKLDPSLIGDYTALNQGIERQAAIVRKVGLAVDEAAAKRQAAYEASLAGDTKVSGVKEKTLEELEKEVKVLEKDLELQQQEIINKAELMAYEKQWLADQSDVRKEGLLKREVDAETARITLVLKGDMVKADEEQRAAEKAWFLEQQQLFMMENELQQMAAATANLMASTMGQSLYNIVTGTNNSLTALKQLWHDFGNSVLRMLTEMIARVILFNTLTAIGNLGTGGGFSFAKSMAKGLFSGQTAEGSTRIVPGPPNLAVPILAHGGETIGRGGSQGGGDTIIIEGDYFASEEADAKLFDRQYKYKKRNGLS
jgi:hypothetical protein